MKRDPSDVQSIARLLLLRIFIYSFDIQLDHIINVFMHSMSLNVPQTSLLSAIWTQGMIVLLVLQIY